MRLKKLNVMPQRGHWSMISLLIFSLVYHGAAGLLHAVSRPGLATAFADAAVIGENPHFR
jgi:hypothetical protein